MSELPAKVGRYEILEIIGRGGMGLVYKARDPNIGRMVALKIIKLDFEADEKLAAEMRERFRREAAAAGVLQHPNIVTVYDAGEDNGVPFIALEYVEGETLERMIRPGELLPISKVASIIGQVASGLAFAHERGIIHRDIKPANVIVTPTGTAKIMDFGIARVAGSDLTQKGMVMGSPAYMAPEQITGAESDFRSDVFSLGVVLYQLLTGEKPFPGDNPTSVSYRILRTEPVEPAKLNPILDPAFNRLIARALAKRPEDRYPGARELAADLEALAQGKPLAAATGDTTLIAAVAAEASAPLVPVNPDATRPHGSGRPEAIATPPERIRKWLPPAAGAALVLLAALGWYFFLRDPYRKAEALIREGRHQEAVVELVEVRKSRPNDPRGACLLGREYAALSQFEQSLEYYSEGIESHHCQENPELLATLAAALAIPEVSETAIRLSVKVGPPMVPALQEALTDPDYDTHWNAASALKKMGETVNEVELHWLDLASNPSCEIRREAEAKIRQLAGADAGRLIEGARTKSKDLPSCEVKQTSGTSGGTGGGAVNPKPKKKKSSNWLEDAIRKLKRK